MKKDPLQAVKMLAEMSEQKKSRAVADSITNLSAARERLALLEQYLSEYSGVKADGSTDIERLKSQQSFLGALAQAIGDQNTSVEQSYVLLEARIEHWRAARANSKAVNQLTEKRAEVRRKKVDQQEQIELDAAGQRQRR